jgi:hypothetical protein
MRHGSRGRSSAAVKGIDALAESQQSFDAEDALSTRARWPIRVRPLARHSHARAVSEAHHDLRRASLHHFEELPFERVVPAGDRYLRRRWTTVVLSL